MLTGHLENNYLGLKGQSTNVLHHMDQKAPSFKSSFSNQISLVT